MKLFRKMITRRYIPSGGFGEIYFFEDEYLSDACENGFGVAQEALQFGFEELCRNSNRFFYSFNIVKFTFFAMLNRYSLADILTGIEQANYLVFRRFKRR